MLSLWKLRRRSLRSAISNCAAFGSISLCTGCAKAVRCLPFPNVRSMSALPFRADIVELRVRLCQKQTLVSPKWSERRNRVDDFLCGHNGTGVVRDINVESGVHLLIRVIRRCIFYHRDFVAKLSGKANGRRDAGVCYESDDDELLNAVLLEL